MCRIFETFDRRKVAGFSLDDLSDIKSLLARGEIHGVVVDVPLFTQNEINLLGGMEDIQVLTLRFNTNKKLSLEFVKDLPLLDDFGVNGVCPTINFDNFSKLATLIIEWNPNVFKNPESSKLKELHLWKMNSTDFEPLIEFSSLNSLLLNKTTLSSLKGIEKLRHLKELKLVYMKNLLDISALADTCLEKIGFQNAKKIQDYSPLGKCSSLKRLRINESAPIANFNFIKSLESLDSFRFMKNDVIDGDLSSLLRLDDVVFTPKKHFSHSPKDFKKNECETFF